MINEELEREVKRLEEQITNLRIRLLESKVDKKPYEVEVPEDIKDYYYVDEGGSIEGMFVFNEIWMKKVYRRGLVFKTEEEIEKYEKERILLFKLHKWAKEHNGDWTPNWEDLEEEKWVAMYDNKYKIFEKEGIKFTHWL